MFKKINVVMNQLKPVDHALKMNIGWNVKSVVNTSVLGLKLGLNHVQNVRIQAICHRARSAVLLKTNVFVTMDFIATQVFIFFMKFLKKVHFRNAFSDKNFPGLSKCVPRNECRAD